MSVREFSTRGAVQVGILGQIAASLRAGLSAALAPAVDPRTTYVNAHEKQQALLAQVGRAMDQVTASKHRLQARAADDRARLPKMLEDARDELVAGRSDSARLVLRERHRPAGARRAAGPGAACVIGRRPGLEAAARRR